MALCLRRSPADVQTPPWRNGARRGNGGRSASGTVSNPPSSATSAPATGSRAAGRSPPSRPPCAVDQAMAAFCRRCQAGQAPGYPRFKARHRWDSVEWPRDGDGCRWTPGTGRMHLQGVGHIKVHAHRAVEGMVKTISLKREGRRWYVVLSCDGVPARPLPATGRQAGLDVGVARFATTSDGQIIPNPKFLQRTGHRCQGTGRRTAGALAEETRAGESPPGPGEGRRGAPPDSRNRRSSTSTTRPPERSSEHVTRSPWKNLNTAGMTRRPAPEPDPERPGAYLSNGAAAKAGLNKSILDAGWAQFANILIAKVEETGRRVIFVNPARTSIDCHLCGRRCTRPQQDTVICPVHGAIDADINGAKNIHTRAGLGSGRLGLVRLVQPEKLTASAVRAVTDKAYPARLASPPCSAPDVGRSGWYLLSRFATGRGTLTERCGWEAVPTRECPIYPAG